MPGLLPVLTFLKTIGGPGSIGFLVVALIFTIGAALVWPRWRHVWRTSSVVVVAGYLALSLPIVANAVIDRLPRVDAARVPSDEPLEALFVISGDNTVARAAEAARIYEAAKPTSVWLLGNDHFWSELVRDGIPRAKIIRVSDGRNTDAQMDRVVFFAAANRFTSVGIVASQFQMPRIEAIMKKRGVRVRLFPSPPDETPVDSGVGAFVPAFGALAASRDALYEHVALVYYRWRGLI